MQTFLNKHKIGIDSKENGVWLPNNKNTDGLAGIKHNGKHPNDYFKNVHDRISAADARNGKQGVLDELGKIRSELGNAPRDASWKTVVPGVR